MVRKAGAMETSFPAPAFSISTPKEFFKSIFAKNSYILIFFLKKFSENAPRHHIY
jgi:hypothetical protein